MAAASFDARWLPFRQKGRQAALRLFCLPHAGGSASQYVDWQSGVPDWIEICAVQLPGRGTRLGEPLLVRVTEMARVCVDGLRPLLDEPFAIFGHSMGALIGYEMAKLLRARNGPMPEALIVAGARAPHIPRTEPLTYDLEGPAFIEQLRQIDGTPPQLFEHPEAMALLLPIIRADFEAVQTYPHDAPGAPLQIPIAALGGLFDDEVTIEDLRAWRAYTTAWFYVGRFPGDHFFVNSAQADVLLRLHKILLSARPHLAGRPGATA